MASVSTLGAGFSALDVGGASIGRGAAQKLSQLLTHGSRRSLDQTPDRQSIVLLPRQPSTAAAHVGLLDTDYVRSGRHGRPNPLHQLVSVSPVCTRAAACIPVAVAGPLCVARRPDHPPRPRHENFAWLPVSFINFGHALLHACDRAGCARDGPVSFAAQVDLPVHSELPAALYRLQDAAVPVDLPPRHRVDVRMLDNRELDKLVGALGRNKVSFPRLPAGLAAEERWFGAVHTFSRE